jgi:hypothetical protein
MKLRNQTQNYMIFIYSKLININEYQNKRLLNQFNLDNIENKTIKELKELLHKKNFRYCPHKLKLYLKIGDGIAYSDYNDTPYKTIKECFPEKEIYFNYDKMKNVNVI